MGAFRGKGASKSRCLWVKVRLGVGVPYPKLIFEICVEKCQQSKKKK